METIDNTRDATMQQDSADASYWASGGSRLHIAAAPEGAVNLNVEGRMVTSPIQGFGKMWQKTYAIRLDGVEACPADVIRVWKARFSEFWPDGNHFYGPITGIAPGEVALLNLAMPGRQQLSTGVLVLYADDESFTLMTPQGHMLAGWITFSAHEDDGATIAQAQVLIRASDPLYEVAMVCAGFRREDRFWTHTLKQVAAHFGVTSEVTCTAVCVDSRRQWRRAGNVWQNAAIRTGLYNMTTPVRQAGRLLAARRDRS
jgi:hypothetical protein